MGLDCVIAITGTHAEKRMISNALYGASTIAVDTKPAKVTRKPHSARALTRPPSIMYFRLIHTLNDDEPEHGHQPCSVVRCGVEDWVGIGIGFLLRSGSG